MGMGIGMRTVLDVTVCAHSRGGVGRWVQGLSSGLMDVSREHLSIDLPETHPGVRCPVPHAVAIPSPSWMKVPLARRFMLHRGRLESGRASRIGRVAGNPDIMHLSGVQPFGVGRRLVVTFFDHTPWTDPASHTETTLFYAGRLAKLVDGGASVLAISEWAAARAVELFRIPSARVGVAGGAADELFSPGEPDHGILEKLGLGFEGFYLHVGSFVPRKNIPFLVDCFERAETQGRKLVLAGAERWGPDSHSGTEGVLTLGAVSDHVLLALYRAAEAVLIPSSEEGLSLPVLEAFACGTPVICSNGGALPETSRGAALLLPVLDRDAWVNALETGATGAMKTMAAQAPRPTWRIVAERAMEFYRSLS
jgi:glycosyltransferase involved in cell wall biosynthesis